MKRLIREDDAAWRIRRIGEQLRSLVFAMIDRLWEAAGFSSVQEENKSERIRCQGLQ